MSDGNITIWSAGNSNSYTKAIDGSNFLSVSKFANVNKTLGLHLDWKNNEAYSNPNN